MSTSTNVSLASGSSAVVPTVIKRRSTSLEAPKAFTLDAEPVQKRDAKSPVEPGQEDPTISDAEKQYFTNLFPTAAEAIRSYSPYQKSGMKQAASIGTLVDVKG
jgi:hypothetical protein